MDRQAHEKEPVGEDANLGEDGKCSYEYLGDGTLVTVRSSPKCSYEYPYYSDAQRKELASAKESLRFAELKAEMSECEAHSQRCKAELAYVELVYDQAETAMAERKWRQGSRSGGLYESTTNARERDEKLQGDVAQAKLRCIQCESQLADIHIQHSVLKRVLAQDFDFDIVTVIPRITAGIAESPDLKPDDKSAVAELIEYRYGAASQRELKKEERRSDHFQDLCDLLQTGKLIKAATTEMTAYNRRLLQLYEGLVAAEQQKSDRLLPEAEVNSAGLAADLVKADRRVKTSS